MSNPPSQGLRGLTSGFGFLTCIALAFMLSGCYVTRLAFRQNTLYNGRRPISEVLADPKTNADTRARLITLADVLAYAKDAGLKTEEAYRYYIEIPGGIISFTVQASEPLKFKSKTWWFPVVGRVPYLGFFEKEERDQEAARLKAEGLDAFSGVVGGFSSLGWFEDPVYSPMLERDAVNMALLFFHELTHRTFWLSDSTLFNEQLAEYVARKLTRSYLASKNLNKELQEAESFFRDESRLAEWIKQLKTELEVLYGTEEALKGSPAALAAKQKIIRKYQTELLPKWETTRFGYVGKREWNNAVILGASLYSPDEARFEKAYECSKAKSVGRFLEILQDRLESADKAFDDLDHLCG